MRFTPTSVCTLLGLYAVNGATDQSSIRKPDFETLLGLGLIGLHPEIGGVYHVTERGKVWAEMICSTPLPVERWIDPRTENERDASR